MELETQKIADLFKRKLIKEFHETFTVFHYSRKKLCKETGIGYHRMGSIINDPGKMKIGEMILIADHFKIDWKILSRMIELQVKQSKDLLSK